MCGIAGVISSAPLVLDRGMVGRVMRLIAHRGPDAAGWFAWSQGQQSSGGPPEEPRQPVNVVLLHTRLSIIDTSAAGCQPMQTVDGRYVIVLNGEIYNYVELREQLGRLGHRFHSRSDTEVLLTAFAHWGPGCLERLVGMFAFAVLDTRDKTVFLARDYFGIKPLYVASTPGGLVFASEIGALLELGQLPRTVDAARLFAYLRYGITDHGDGSLFAEVQQVPAGGCTLIDIDHTGPPEFRCYWQPGGRPRAELSLDEATRRVRDLFLDSVRLHLRSDVPVGSALSGGIDSSAIVMAMRRLGGPELVLHTFSFVPADEALSEERWVDVVVDAAHTTAHKVHVSPEELSHDLEELIRVQEEPFGGTSVYAQFRVCRLAREHGIKVLLDGQGADELLGGYRFYLAARLASLVRLGSWADAARLLRACGGLPGVQRLQLVLRSADFLVPSRYQSLGRTLVGQSLFPSWVARQWFVDRGVRPASLSYTRSEDVLRDYLVRTLTTTMLPHLLRYEDRNSMAFSIESRVPFLTRELAELLLTLPEEYIIAPDGTSKSIFRRAMRGLVPDPILERRDKVGFATPERAWMRALQPWVDQVVGGDGLTATPALDARAVRSEWARIARDGKPFDARVWRWVNLVEWTRQFNVTF